MEQLARFFPPETTGFLCLGMLVLGVFGLLIRNSLRRQEVASGWDNLAFRMGLAYEPDPQENLPLISGQYRGRPILVEMVPLGLRQTLIYTRVSFLFRSPAKGDLTLFREKELGLLETSRLPEIEIESEPFDSNFTIKCESLDFALTALDDKALQNALVELDAVVPFRLSVTRKKLTCTFQDVPQDTALLEKMIVTLGDLADRVDKPQDGEMFFKHSAIDENWDDDDEA